MTFRVENPIPAWIFPEPEQDAAREIDRALTNTAQFLNDFAAALALFDFCEAERISQSIMFGGNGPWLDPWCFLAARDGALSVYHFKHAKDGLNGAIFKCPSAAAHVDRSKLGEGHDKFSGRFPKFEAMRHGVSHAGEIDKNPSQRADNAFSGSIEMAGIKLDNVTQAMVRSLVNREYSLTVNGQIVSYLIDHVSLAHLRGSLDLFVSALTPIRTAIQRTSDGQQP